VQGEGNGSAKPLEGVSVLALEQMQALPVATQLMARLGAKIVKIEPPGRGDAGRGAQPALLADGQSVGATFLRNNLGKKSISIDLKADRGRQLVLALSSHFDVVCENLGPGRAERFGLDYQAVSAVSPAVVYLSISGFGASGESPYSAWPAYAAVAEAMSGAYEFGRLPHRPPVINPMGGLGDTGTGLFGLIGILAALRHRDRTGEGQFVDVSMYDAMVSMCDVAVNYWSMGVRRDADDGFRSPGVVDGFQASDGWFMMQISRRHQLERLADVLDEPGWKDDDRLGTAWGWRDHLEDVIRPAVEAWAAHRTKLEAARTLAESGIAAAPCNRAEDVVGDPHLEQRRMLLEIPRTDGVEQPVLVAGNPVKMSRVRDEPSCAFPRLGADTDEVLRTVLGLGDEAIGDLRQEGVIA
jgi:crotonobetainyl-CoA:carnitine CoA-transferase CaiB-like acyl-CoA transferase